MQLKEVPAAHELSADPVAVAGMVRFGINPEKTLGVSTSDIRGQRERARPGDRLGTFLKYYIYLNQPRFSDSLCVGTGTLVAFVAFRARSGDVVHYLYQLAEAKGTTGRGRERDRNEPNR